jgi:putative Mg2+ transporter-C (MgtC) family protein
VEARLPTESYASFVVRFKRDAAISEADLRKLVADHGFALYNISYRLHGQVDVLEYRTVIRTMQPGNLARLASTLSADSRVIEYRIAPTSE